MEEQVSITAMTYGSAAIGRLENGKAVFVEGAMPGDTVMANIQEEKASFCRGTVSQILEASPSRIQSPCPYADLCGGCPWSHMSYEAQLAAKRENLMGNLTRIGKMEAETVSQLVADVVPSKHQWHYRNKIELAAGTDERGQLQVGMHRRDGQGILPVDTCLLAHKKVHKAPKALKGSLRFIAGQGQDLNIFRVGLRHSNNTGDTEVALDAHRPLPPLPGLPRAARRPEDHQSHPRHGRRGQGSQGEKGRGPLRQGLLARGHGRSPLHGVLPQLLPGKHQASRDPGRHRAVGAADRRGLPCSRSVRRRRHLQHPPGYGS